MTRSTSPRLFATDQADTVLRSGPSQQQFLPFGFGAPCGLGFNGQWADPLTERYLLGQGYRAFSPVLMRFLCPDSWSPFGDGGINCYAYCVGDPVNVQDPTGHMPKGFRRLFGLGSKASEASASASTANLLKSSHSMASISSLASVPAVPAMARSGVRTPPPSTTPVRRNSAEKEGYALGDIKAVNVTTTTEVTLKDGTRYVSSATEHRSIGGFKQVTDENGVVRVALGKKLTTEDVSQYAYSRSKSYSIKRPDVPPPLPPRTVRTVRD